LFPRTFTAEAWQPHKPLKRGIHRDLVARGVLLPAECRRVFAHYGHRRAYQVALAGGGVRIDLDGEPSGELTAAEREAAKRVIARLDALMIEKAKAAAAQAKAAAKLKLMPAPEAGAERPSGLADLKRAAAERKQAGRHNHV